MSKRNIQFAPPDEPAFLKKLKSKIGYKQNFDNIDTKAEKLKKEGVLYDKEEEEPVYVYEDSSHITEKELETYKTKMKNEREASVQDVQDAKDASQQKRMVFTKPTKKKDGPEGMQRTQSSSSRQKFNHKDESKDYRKYVKPVKNTNLLSFGDDDDEEDEE